MAWTLEKLQAHFPQDDPANLARILRIVRGEASPDDVPNVAKWIRECYHYPSLTERRMRAFAALLDGAFDTGAIWGDAGDNGWPVAEYVNMGDTYAATILYDYVRGKFTLTTMGDFVEKYERRYGIR